MQGTPNAHRLFRGTTSVEGYLDNLQVNAAKEKQLRAARDKLRDALREGLARLETSAIAKGFYDRRYVALASPAAKLRPRFRMQGSAAYHTLNDPAQKPPQEIDYDYGVYLPTSFVGRRAEPIVAAQAFFKTVEDILAPVCEANGWTLNRTKLCCVRVQISRDAHIDLPLYAIPDADFIHLTEAAEAMMHKASPGVAFDSDEVFSEQVYRSLPQDRIMLAQRTGEWIESDPRKIEEWFREALDEHGDALRYVCRYLKGWRDFQWSNCKLSSLSIMACVVAAFDDLRGTLPDNRDDTALVAVAERMPALLEQPIKNPVIPSQFLDENWKASERADFATKARQLYAELKTALNENYHPGNAINRLTKAFGARIPRDETLLSIDGAEREVLSYKPAAVSAPRVIRSQSG